jgi:hypothetical protein
MAKPDSLSWMNLCLNNSKLGRINVAVCKAKGGETATMKVNIAILSVIMGVFGYFAYTQDTQTKIRQERGEGSYAMNSVYRNRDKLIRDQSGVTPGKLSPEIMAVIAQIDKKIPLTSKRVK